MHSIPKPTVASATVVHIERYENFKEWMEKNGWLPADDEAPESDISTRKLFLTIFENETGSEKFKGEHTLPEWQRRIQIATADEKEKLFWLKGLKFGDKLSERGSYRTNENAEALTAVVVEHDKGTISFDEALAIVEKANLRGLGYTSPSYQKVTKERWRFIFPLSRDNPPERHEILVAYVNGIFGGKLAPESFVLSLSYYFGSVNNPEHRVEIIDGKFLDLADRLFAGRRFKDGGKEEPKPRDERTRRERINDLNGFEALGDHPLPHADSDEVAAALKVINADNYLVWRDIGAALADEYGDEGKQVFSEWSMTSEKFDEKICGKKWRDFCQMTEIGIGTVFHYADEADPNWREQLYEWQRQREEREWLYGRHLIRRFGSATVAPGGAGKSTLIIAEALALVTGRPLLGVTPNECCKVWLWNGEDPLEEIERRIAAACLHYGIIAKEIAGSLFVNGRESEIIIAQQTRDGVKVAVPMVEALQHEIAYNKIDVMCIDPFISSHRVTENDNNSIDLVAKIWTKIADTTNTAIDLVHHVRKTGGAEVTVEDARGAGAMINAVRSSRVLNTMSEGEAEKAGIDSRRGYFRIDDGKMNLAPPSDVAKWFHLQSIELGNGPPNDPFGCGDKVAVVTQWTWPDPLEDVSGSDVEKVFMAIRAGRWREDIQAKYWVGHAVANAMGLYLDDKADKSKVKGLLKIWIRAGKLTRVQGLDDQRKTKTFVEVAEDLEEERTTASQGKKETYDFGQKAHNRRMGD